MLKDVAQARNLGVNTPDIQQTLQSRLENIAADTKLKDAQSELSELTKDITSKTKAAINTSIIISSIYMELNDLYKKLTTVLMFSAIIILLFATLKVFIIIIKSFL